MTQAHSSCETSARTPKTAKIYFVEKDSQKSIQVEAYVGMTLLEVTRQHGIDLEGACDGALACSTCHVIVAPEWYGRLPEPSVDEDDMLDLAFGLTPTSRLGCQIIVTEELDGLTVVLPSSTRHLTTSMSS